MKIIKYILIGFMVLMGLRTYAQDPLSSSSTNATSVPYTYNLENPSLTENGKWTHKTDEKIYPTRVSCDIMNGAGSVRVNINLRDESSPDTPGPNLLKVDLLCESGTTHEVKLPGFTSQFIQGKKIQALVINEPLGVIGVLHVYVYAHR